MHLDIDDRVRFFANNLLLGRDPATLIDEAAHLPPRKKGPVRSEAPGPARFTASERASLGGLIGNKPLSKSAEVAFKKALMEFFGSLAKRDVTDKL